MADQEDNKITLEAIKSSLEVIENNTVELKQVKDSLQSIERLLEELLGTANEAVGILEVSQPPEPNEPAPARTIPLNQGNPLPCIFAIGIFVVLSLLIWKWEPVRASRGIPANGTQISTANAH